jgi:FkbM family methyltransferase
VRAALFRLAAEGVYRVATRPGRRGAWRLVQAVEAMQPASVPPFVITRGGLRWRCDLSFGFYDRDLLVSGKYEPETIALLESIVRPGAVAIDVGANIGLITLHLARLVGPAGRVLAFEPGGRFFERLVDAVQLNGFEDRVEVHRTALGAAAAAAPLHLGTTTASLVLSDGLFGDNDEVVQVVTLDALLTGDRALERLDIIKIDVDGSEVDVLAGARQVIRRFLPVLLIEICPSALSQAGASAAQLIDLLVDLGYSRFQVPGSGEMRDSAAVHALADSCATDRLDFFNLACFPVSRA